MVTSLAKTLRIVVCGKVLIWFSFKSVEGKGSSSALFSPENFAPLFPLELFSECFPLTSVSTQAAPACGPSPLLSVSLGTSVYLSSAHMSYHGGFFPLLKLFSLVFQ